MKPTPVSLLPLAGAALSLLLSCSGSSSKRDFTVESCKTVTCGAEAQICTWTSSDPKYLGCLTDCETLGKIATVCPKEAQALYTCADLGANVDCTTGKGKGCDAELQNLTACMPVGDAGR